VNAPNNAPVYVHVAPLLGQYYRVISGPHPRPYDRPAYHLEAADGFPFWWTAEECQLIDQTAATL
jgi:hypothetical protein